MRKTRLLAALGLVAVLLTGCRNEDTRDISSTPSVSITEKAASTSSAFKSENTDESVMESDISYVSMLPDPSEIFPDSEFNIIDNDGGRMYVFQVTGYDDGEYDAYIKACTEKGFTKVQVEINAENVRKWESRTDDEKFYVSIQMLPEDSVINVTCAKRNVD